MNRFLLAVVALTFSAGVPLGHAASEKPVSHSLVYGSSITAEIDPCG